MEGKEKGSESQTQVEYGIDGMMWLVRGTTLWMWREPAKGSEKSMLSLNQKGKTMKRTINQEEHIQRMVTGWTDRSRNNSA